MLDFRKIEEIRKEIDKDVRLSQNKFAVQSWIKYTSYTKYVSQWVKPNNAKAVSERIIRTFAKYWKEVKLMDIIDV